MILGRRKEGGTEFSNFGGGWGSLFSFSSKFQGFRPFVQRADGVENWYDRAPSRRGRCQASLSCLRARRSRPLSSPRLGSTGDWVVRRAAGWMTLSFWLVHIPNAVGVKSFWCV